MVAQPRHHPGECAIRQPAFIFFAGITAAHIGMRAGEQNLANPGVGIPRCGREILPQFVDRHGMIPVFDDPAEFGIGELEQIHPIQGNVVGRNAERADRIPYPNSLDFGRAQQIRLGGAADEAGQIGDQLL